MKSPLTFHKYVNFCDNLRWNTLYKILTSPHSSTYYLIMFDTIDKYNSDYENVRKIGSGKFGTVFQVRNQITGEIFAAKFVK